MTMKFFFLLDVQGWRDEWQYAYKLLTLQQNLSRFPSG